MAHTALNGATIHGLGAISPEAGIFGGSGSEESAMDDMRAVARHSTINAFIDRVSVELALRGRRKTHLAYADSLRSWSRFAVGAGLDFMPLEYGGLRSWMEWQVDQGYKASTIKVRTALVAQVTKLLGYGDPRSGGGEVGRRRLQRLGAEAREASGLKQARALRLDELCAILGACGGKERWHDQAWLSLGWLAALRSGEILGLEVRDLELQPDGVGLYLRSSKGDRKKVGVRLHAGNIEGRVDVAGYMRRWLGQLRRRQGTDPTLRVFGMSYNGLRRRLVRLAKAAGVSQACLSPHSLRSGFATEAAMAGVSPLLLQRQMRHANLAQTEKYFRVGEHTAIAESLSDAIGKAVR